MTIKADVHALGMLYYLEEDNPLFLRTDASNASVGGILFQRVTTDDIIEALLLSFPKLSVHEKNENATINYGNYHIFFVYHIAYIVITRYCEE